MDYECVVVGAGISGLSAAEALARRGVRVLLLEAASQVGGALRSERTADGFLLEHGPNTVTSNDPDLWQQFNDLGIAADRLVAARSGARRYILFRGQAVPLPLALPAFLASPLLSPLAKLRLLAEPLMPRSGTSDESVAAFFARRLGAEPFQRLIDPFVSGAYAGDPAAISMRAAFTRIWEAEQRAGSIVLGMLGARSAGTKGGPKRGKRELFSFRDGLSSRPKAIAGYLGPERLWTDARLLALRPADGEWQLQVRRAGQSQHMLVGQVVLATPADAAANLVERLDSAAARALRAIPYPPMTIVHLGYLRADVAHPLDGFGLLCPAAEGRSVLGTLWPSSLFPGRAPDGAVLTSSFIGGARYPDLARQSEGELIAAAHAEQQFLIGVRGQPILAKVARWERAIPQYIAGHHERIAAVERLESHCDGLHLVANYRDGVSVERCWQRGRAVAGVAAALVEAGRERVLAGR